MWKKYASLGKNWINMDDIVKCVDCGCYPKDCKDSGSPQVCPYCSRKESCCWTYFHELWISYKWYFQLKQIKLRSVPSLIYDVDKDCKSVNQKDRVLFSAPVVEIERMQWTQTILYSRCIVDPSLPALQIGQFTKSSDRPSNPEHSQYDIFHWQELQ